MPKPCTKGMLHRIQSVRTRNGLSFPVAGQVTLNDIVRSTQQSLALSRFSRLQGSANGMLVLFSGSRGTGKTMAAEILARKLRTRVYRVNLKRVVSRYIGETEKNLLKIFKLAEQKHLVLLFDEADAIFGKRAEVKDSHDRYANIETNYLLSRMEGYKGLVILTSNLKTPLDPKLLCRLRYHVVFNPPQNSSLRIRP